MRNTPFLLALDISATRTGVAEGHIGDAPLLYSVRFKKGDQTRTDALIATESWIIARLRQRRPDFLAIEEQLPMMSNTNFDTVRLLCGIPAVIIGAAGHLGVKKLRLAKAPEYEVKVSTVRAGFIGKGNLKSDQAKYAAANMCQQLGWAASNHDESDAAAVWWWASSRLYPDLAPPITPLMQQKAVSFGMGFPR